MVFNKVTICWVYELKTTSDTYVLWTFPIAFKTKLACIVVTTITGGNTDWAAAANERSKTSVKLWVDSRTITAMAIGY